MADPVEVHDSVVQVDLAELEELRRLKMVQEAKAELIAWGRQWATIITITVAVVGLIGLNVLVATVVRGSEVLLQTKSKRHRRQAYLRPTPWVELELKWKELQRLPRNTPSRFNR